MDESTATGQTPPPGPLGLPVGVVGAGRVGSVLGAAFRYAGYPLEAVCGSARRSPATDERIARLLPGVEVVDTPAQVLDRALLIVLAVPDDVLPSLVDDLARSGAIRPGQLLLHTAGRYGISVLAPLAPLVVPLALHPAMTFTSGEADLARLRGAPFGVTSTPEARELAELIVREIGGEPVWIDEADRVRYHAALAHGCNHLVTLVAQARELLERIGIPDSADFLRPLLEATLANALARGDAALTGPVARGDIGTLREHFTALADTPTDIPATYRALALATAWRRATRHTGDPDRAAATFHALRAATVPDFPDLPDFPSDLDAPVPPPEGAHVPPLAPLVVHTRADLATARDNLQRRAPGDLGVVMTMGALHEGHASLLRIARERHAAVLVTIFVNPLQFGPSEDFGRYPRTLPADLEVCRSAGVDVVFAPSVDEMYPGGEPMTRITATGLATVLEGAHRPGHFDGMLTVVNKLLNLTRPDVSYYGQKDAQQLLLIRRMVADLNLPVRIEALPIVREPDGLALSSRNRYLSADDRQVALALSRALRAGVAEATSGAGAVRAAATAVLAEQPGIALDYLALVDPATLHPVADDATGLALLAVAGKVGSTRLIDNSPLVLGPGGGPRDVLPGREL